MEPGAVGRRAGPVRRSGSEARNPPEPEGGRSAQVDVAGGQESQPQPGTQRPPPDRWASILGLVDRLTRRYCTCHEREGVKGKLTLRMVVLGEDRLEQVRNLQAYLVVAIHQEAARHRKAELRRRQRPATVANSKLLQGLASVKQRDPCQVHRLIEEFRRRLLARLSARDREFTSRPSSPGCPYVAWRKPLD